MLAPRAGPGFKQPSAGLIKAPERMAGGLLLLVIAGIGLTGTQGLAIGTLALPGAGLLPRIVCTLLGLVGALLVVLSVARSGPGLERWHGRGIVCVLGAAVLFGLTIRGFEVAHVQVKALGLAVAAPVAMLVASLADPTTRAREIIPFALLLTVVCIVLFRFVLRLPIPIAPWLVGY
jgi:Tripartite tricarboxylate transporter TctB family